MTENKISSFKVHIGLFQDINLFGNLQYIKILGFLKYFDTIILVKFFKLLF
jgi:hypothetical protein